MGFKECTREMIYGSAYTTARYVREKYPEIKKVRVVGMKSIGTEFAEQGIASCGGEEDGMGRLTLEEFESYKLDPEVSAVVVGLDTNFTYAKLCIASLYIHTGGAKFIATNDDSYDMVAGRKYPAAGAMVSSIKYSLGQMSAKEGSL
jgi:4-nitrophenyl phosphatase